MWQVDIGDIGKKRHLITMDFVQVLFSWLHSGQTPLLAMAPPHATFSTYFLKKVKKGSDKYFGGKGSPPPR